jgi:hypothetical protein
MSVKTCAACDCNLEGETIKVKVGRETIEMCCEGCAHKLKEADPSTLSAKRSESRKGTRLL